MSVSKVSLDLFAKVPDPATDKMIALLHSVLEGTLGVLPFPFTAGDVMSAATAILIDAGMVSVMEGKQTKEELEAEICAVIREAIQTWRPGHSNVTSDELANRTTQ